MSRTVNFGQSVSEKGIDPGKTLSPPSLFGYFAAARPDLDHSTTRMWISPWACLDPRAKGCSEQVRSPGASFLRSSCYIHIAVVSAALSTGP